MDDISIQDVTDAFERWYDASDIPDEVINEIATILSGTIAALLLSYPGSFQLLFEAVISIFNMGRAYGYPDPLGREEK